jgi:phosphatidate cytidylyltransferase
MLLQRVITAVVLLALLLPALFAPVSWPFAVLSLVLIAAAGWEWARLNGVAKIAAVGPGLLLALAGAWALHTGAAARVSPAVWWGVSAAWLVFGAVALRAGPSGWPSSPAPLRLFVGLLVLWFAWMALAQARALSVNFVLSALCVVWVADIGAYFAGRTFGRRKLAPSISPGKTWEGVAGGMVGVFALALSWLAVVDASWPVDGTSLFAHVRAKTGLGGLALACAVLAGLSVVGDLFESLVKRAAGAKDSSRLLPGHGGVLDRIDALLPVLPAVMALRSL